MLLESHALPPKHKPITTPDDALTDDAPFKPLDPWLHANSQSIDYGVLIGCGVVVGTWLLLNSYSVGKRARKYRETLMQRVEVFEAGAVEVDEVHECIRAQGHVAELLDFHSEVRQYIEYCRMLDEVRVYLNLSLTKTRQKSLKIEFCEPFGTRNKTHCSGDFHYKISIRAKQVRQYLEYCRMLDAARVFHVGCIAYIERVFSHCIIHTAVHNKHVHARNQSSQNELSEI